MTELRAASPLTYKTAGVDIDAGDALVERIRRHAASTLRREVLGGLGGFGALVRPELAGMREPVLVSSTDGVGTKLLVAQAVGRHDTVGIDLVAMCVNDVVVQGADPLFFLDYFACGRLEVDTAEAVIAGIAEGCRQAGSALIGGETAEMPDFYPEGRYDLAGFSVGVVDRPKIIDGSRVRAGDAVVGLASTGFHSNGYSLLRKVVRERMGLAWGDRWPGLDASVADVLLTPTRIYAKVIAALMSGVDLRAAAHITGGGITENLPRVLPDGTAADIDLAAWPVPKAQRDVAEAAGLDADELLRTFNAGLGMMVVMPSTDAPRAVEIAAAFGVDAWVVGAVVPGTGEAQVRRRGRLA